MIALRAARLFDGIAMRGPATVLIDGAHIVAILDDGAPPDGATLHILPADATLVPGFIDLQVNGGGGVLFNNAIDVDAVRAIAGAHASVGTTSILPTLISGTRPQIDAALSAARKAVEQKVPGMLGLHIEGPFISPSRRGIHPATSVREMTDEDAELLGSSGLSTLLLTLAPERVSAARIGALATRAVTVFAGHTDATAYQARAGLHAGITGFTHLFNAMSQFGSRAPGAVGAALADPSAYAGIIVDGFHVDPISIAAAHAAIGPARLFLVSDAMATAASDTGEFDLNGATIRLRAGKLTDDSGTLAGAHLTMADAVRNAVDMVGLPLGDALRMATATPASCMGLRDRGRITPGCRADLVCLGNKLDILNTWLGGRVVGPA